MSGMTMFIALTLATASAIAQTPPGAKAFWEVKAVRNDLWVRTHGAPVEVQKDDVERCTYQYSALYGQPAETGIDFRPITTDTPPRPALESAP